MTTRQVRQEILHIPWLTLERPLAHARVRPLPGLKTPGRGCTESCDWPQHRPGKDICWRRCGLHRRHNQDKLAIAMFLLTYYKIYNSTPRFSEQSSLVGLIPVNESIRNHLDGCGSRWEDECLLRCVVSPKTTSSCVSLDTSATIVVETCWSRFIFWRTLAATICTDCVHRM